MEIFYMSFKIRSFMLILLLILIILLICNCQGKKDLTVWPEDISVFWKDNIDTPVDLEIYLDISKPETGKASVIIFFKCRRDQFVFKGGKKGEFCFENVEFYDSKGNPITYGKAKDDYILKTGDYEKVFIKYDVMPGGEGRHGRQGYICNDFASFDGRVFLLPVKGNMIESARIQFKVPEGWKIINPHRQDGKWYYPDNSGKEVVYKNLSKSFMAFGPFDCEKNKFGNTEVSVYTFSKWDQEHKKTITEKSFKLYEYFYKTFGFDPSFPYLLCWTPSSRDNKRIFSAVWSNGCCYEMPQDRLKNWELLGHRIAHALNKYEPAGMKLKGEENAWFLEGWATSTEIPATVYSGAAEDKKRFNYLYEKYLKTIKEYPDFDFPLINDSEAGADAIEFLHYYKSPLIMYMLDFEIRERTGKNMDQFMDYAYKKYGSFKSPFPFKAELESFTGADFDDFWNIMIKEKGYVIPVWNEYITEDIKNKKINPDSSSRILREEKDYRKKLKEKGIILYPETIEEYMPSLPEEVQKLILNYEKKRWECIKL